MYRGNAGKTMKHRYNIPHGSSWGMVVEHILTFPRGKVLDIPSGNLWLTRILLEKGFDCTADDICYLEPTEKMTALGIELNRSNLDKPLTQYTDESYDYVISLMGLEHIMNPFVALGEFHRIVKLGGTVFLAIPNMASITSRLRFLLTGELAHYPHIIGEGRVSRHLHISVLPLSPLDYIASEMGFEVKRIQPFERIRPSYCLLTGLLRYFITAVSRRIKSQYNDLPVKQTLDSNDLLMNKSLFIVLGKISAATETACLGDFGYYPSIGIL